jgi:hypothetical protein
LPFWVQSESVVLSFLDLLEKLKYRSLWKTTVLTCTKIFYTQFQGGK